MKQKTFPTNDEALRYCAGVFIASGRNLMPRWSSEWKLFFIVPVTQQHPNVAEVVERLRIKGCDGKKGYKTKRDADHAASIRGGAIGMKLYTYECGFCGKWHLTRGNGEKQ